MRASVGFVLASGLLAVVCSVGGLSAQGNPEAAKLTNPVPSTPESIAAGEATYKRRCSACHGSDAKGGPPKEDFLAPGSNLVDDKYDHGSSDGEIFYVIKNGVAPDLVMAAWGERLSDTEIWNLVNFIRDIAKKGRPSNPSNPGQARATQWDGVFTADQAVRGAPIYAQFCERCHGTKLEGEGHAPALADEGFAANWNDRPLSELFEKTKDTMPPTAPGRLTAAQTADLIAFMLQKGSSPAGVTELAASVDALKQIRYLAKKP